MSSESVDMDRERCQGCDRERNASLGCLTLLPEEILGLKLRVSGAMNTAEGSLKGA